MDEGVWRIQLTVGLDQWKKYKRIGLKEPWPVARKQVGQEMTISITVDKDSKAETVAKRAVEAFKQINTTLESIKTFHLLYPDLKFLPGSKDHLCRKSMLSYSELTPIKWGSTSLLLMIG